MIALIIIFLLACPGVAIIWTWTRYSIVLLGTARIALWFAAASYAFLWIGGIMYRPLLGPDYSHRLYVTIATNLVANLCFAIVTVFRERSKRLKISVGGTCGLVALSWFYMLVVNSTV